MMAACTSDGVARDNVMVITAQNNTDISSPNYPDNYPENLNCAWRIVADYNVGIEIMLKGYETEEKYDITFKYVLDISLAYERPEKKGNAFKYIRITGVNMHQILFYNVIFCDICIIFVLLLCS